MSSRYKIRVYRLRDVHEAYLENELNRMIQDGRTRIISVDYTPRDTIVITEVDLGSPPDKDIGILLPAIGRTNVK